MFLPYIGCPGGGQLISWQCNEYTVVDGAHCAAVSRHRDPHIDDRVLAAARVLLRDHGPAGVTIADAAAHAGVSRPAVYRRWHSRAALLFEALTNDTVPPAMPDLGSVRTELVAAVGHLVQQLVTHDRNVIGDRLHEMIRDPEFAAHVWEARWAPDREQVMVIWDRAVARGEVRADIDGREVMNDLVATCTFRVYFGHHTADQIDVEALVDRVLHGVAPAS